MNEKMKQNQNKLIMPVICVSAFAVASSQAALSILDGDFQASSAGSSVSDSGWWEQNNISDDFAEFIKAESDGNSPDDGDANTTNDVFAAFGTVVNTTGETGRLYQNIGMYSGETSIQIGFTAIDLTNQTFAPLTVEIWYGGTAANAADGATLDTTIGATLADSVTYAAADITNNGAKNLVATLNFTGATNGDAIWLSFGKLTPGSTVAAFDDVLIVPEPSSALLLSFGALGLLRRRR